ncbi:hypothetical protein DNTS_035824, partial [Danionella cerebrum]
LHTKAANRFFSETSSHISMLKHLTLKIKTTGPISVCEYMRDALTNPFLGYYVKNDPIGESGDFVTSPEMSQIFGELLGVWCISEWMAAGKSRVLQLVELGPGRGSLACDVLRVFSQLNPVLGETNVSVHLVEVSPKLTEVQVERLTGNQAHICDDRPFYLSGTTLSGFPIYWYRRLEDVPKGFSLYLAHEFFDALPIYKFERTEEGWREVLIDIDPDDHKKLRFVLSNGKTIASVLLTEKDESRQHVEVSPEAGIIVQKLGRRIAADGGAALIGDYGHDGTKTDTFRAFKDHKLHDVLEEPGMADLTADVDFSYLRKSAGNHVTCMGPITQQSFLKNMGIDFRMQVLLRNCTDDSTRTQLIHSYDMLMNPEKMGHRFQFFTVLNTSRLTPCEEKPVSPVAGFTELQMQ